MRGKQHRLPFLPSLDELLQEFITHRRIQRVGRLIENEQRRPGQQHLQQSHLALHARGELGDGARNIDVENRGQFLQIRKIGPAAQPAQEANQLPAGHVFVEAQLAGQIGDVAAGLDALVPAFVPGNEGPPRGRLQETEHEPEGRRLARAVRPQKAEDFPGAQLEVQALEGPEVAVILGQMFSL